MSEHDEDAWNRLLREVEYYKYEANEHGAKSVRAQEEQGLAVREARRARMILKLVREVYRLGDFGGADVEVEHELLALVAENAVCDRAMFLRAFVSSDGHPRFQVLCALGGDGSRRVGVEVILPQPPRFCFTTSSKRGGPQTAEMRELIGAPHILWGFDPAGRSAILLGNLKENNASRPFEEADQELVDTALSVYLDVLHRKREARRLEQALAMVGQGKGEGARAEPGGSALAESVGIVEAEIQEELRKGGRLTGFLIVDRSAGNGSEFVGYARCSSSPHYRLLRTFRDRADRVYRDATRLIHLARYEFGYAQPITVYAAGAPELQRLAGVWPRDATLPQGAQPPRMRNRDAEISAPPPRPTLT
jgi:hypothetical protein